MRRTLIACALLTLIAASVGSAAVPGTMGYQGVVVDASGTPLDGTVSMTFRIYDVDTGGTALWTESWGVQVEDGVFDVVLGGIVPIDLEFDQTYWLGIQIEAEPELEPRHELAPAPYAHTARRIEPDVVSSISGVTNDEGNIELVAGSNVTITPDDGANTITIASSGGGGGIGGSGTTNTIPKFTDPTTIGDSSITDDGTEVLITNQVDVNDRMWVDGSYSGFVGYQTVMAVTHSSTGSSVAEIDGVWGKSVAEPGYEGNGTLYGTSGSAEDGYECYGMWAYATGGEATNYGIRTRARGTIPGATNYGIYAETVAEAAGTYYAGYFDGNVLVTGTVSKGGGSFKIDHPLDPANKYLYHSFVESPDMMNIYNGNVALDANGEAVVEMPEWFEALNRDFRYQLTCIGGFAPVYVAEEISGLTFRIAGGDPGMKVSWMVTGIRQDPFAEANRIPVEEDKQASEIGKYLHPEVFGLDRTKSVTYRPSARLSDE